ncbi:helix-turn-helix domain-containing protein [Candidatus Parabeggiatoa sp. HSG14]|uniref:helix-turn-helix domain-containing protein n=1 Tax=Candidatus Parabeggiatoa sp. HSG14 TaxID=3055593 RepID=UPI0025A7AAD3|nr:helix-turn-helix domain-containing protein [Thiotrichales bacterium HSG14]
MLYNKCSKNRVIHNRQDVNFSRPINDLLAKNVVYETLQILANGNSWCSASYHELVKKSGFGKTTVISAIKELIGDNRIRKKQVRNEDKSRLPNRYELLIS